MAGKPTKPRPAKGQAKSKPDIDNPEKNPLLHIENKHDFQIETNNLLEDPTALVYEGFVNFDLTKETDHFDMSFLNYDSVIIVILRYYEYLCIAKFKFCYVVPTLESGIIMKDIFTMVKHCLKNRLLMNVPSFETVFEPDIQYIGKIKYL